MISNSFGDKGIDRHGPHGRGGPDGILQNDEIDIKSKAQIGGFGKPHTFQQETGTGTNTMVSVQKPMYGGCFDDSPLIGTTPKYEDAFTDKFSCIYGPRNTNEWSNGTCKDSNGTVIPTQNLQGNSYPISSPANISDYEVNCMYSKSDNNYRWNEDYLRPDDKHTTLDSILEHMNNGRVPDIDIFSQVDVKKNDIIMNLDNQETSVKGIIEETALTKYFFSEENIELLQKALQSRVYKNTGEIISYQSSKELYIVMRSIMLQHANFKVSGSELVIEIQKLNRLVLNYCDKEVTSNVLQYKGYLKDIQKLPQPIDRPSYNESGSRNRTYDLSNHISPVYNDGWASRHSGQ